MALFRKILMLTWKNLIFRKRHYILTGLEIILPTVLIIVVAYIKSKVPPNESGNGDYDNDATVFEVYTQERLLQSLSNRVNRNMSFVAYSPINEQVELIISHLENATSEMGLKWDGYTSEQEIEALISQDLSYNWTSPKYQMVAAIIFEQGFTGNDGGKEFGYKIRIVDQHRETNLLFPTFENPGYDYYNMESYIWSGFVPMQSLIDRAIIEVQGQTNLHDEWLNLQPFPYPSFSYGSEFNDIFNVILPIVLCAGFVFIVTANVKGIVGEKETGIKELLKMLGLPSWLQLLGWMINSIVGLALTMTIIVILLFIPFNSAAGAVIEFSDPTVWWIVLIVFAFSSTAMCFFISSFFQKSTLATTVGILFWLIAYFAIVLPLDRKYSSMNLGQKLTFCLLPHAGLTYAIKVMAGFEGKAVGAQWKNLFEPISTVDSLSVGLILVSMITSTVLYLILTLYVENIMPTEFGVRKPWYYIFQLSTWKTGKASTDAAPSVHSSSSGNTFEADPIGLAAGIDVQGLSKKFGSRTVVNQVSFTMFEGQITALLGHNGAGKTTTISMLTGLIAPSGGTAKINGYDINTDMEAIHANLGLCPQHNMLFEDLTVAEHLMFFARLKGISSNGAKEEVKTLLEKLQLTEKKNVLSKSLSGGQKRKLSLGIALVGESKVVILDEPTSGMDPEARRGFWDLLLEMRGHRTLLLTTHFMEEADVLGDRIAIMADGQIKCYGTPLFLKRCYGAGYTLSLTVSERNHSRNSILFIVHKYFSSAFFKTQDSPSASEMAITIPSESKDTSVFPGMFAELYKRKDELGIETIGMSLTTMDDVFIKVGENVHDEESLPNEPNGADGTEERPRRTDSDENLLTDPSARVQGIRLGFQQFYALFAKRVLYTMRKKRLFLTQLLLPVLLVILAIIVTNQLYDIDKDAPPLTMSIGSYKNPITLYSFNDEGGDVGKVYAETVGSSARASTSSNSLVDALLDIGNKDLAAYRAKYIVAAEINDTTINAMYSSIPYHAAPLTLNLASNTIFKLLLSEEYSIKVTNHPLDSNSDITWAVSDPLYEQTNPLIFAIMLPIGLALAAASFVVFPVEERLCKAKQLQLMTGVNPIIYWVSSLCWDMLLILVLILAVLACFPIFESNYVLTTPEGLSVLFAILITYGFSAISFSHLWSFFSASVVRGFTWITIIHIITGVIMCIIVFVLDAASDYSTAALNGAKTIRTLARIFPTFGAALSTMKFVKTATYNSKCDILDPEILEVLCNPETLVGDESRVCCPNCTSLYPSASCFEVQPYMKWTTSEERYNGTLTTAGIGQEIFYMDLMGVVFQIIIFLIESGILKKLLGRIFKNNESVVKNVEGDDDVKRENEQIDSVITGGKLSEEAMVVANLSKSYGDFASVSNLNFRVHHGECFGLLGVNGAGKTTSFRMLTGDEVPSSGDAFTSMSSLSGNRKRFLASIGYCPQFDGIIGVLSGLEMVKLFCRLRGIRSDSVELESKKWMDRLGLTGSNDVQCRKYSGGMKRRLSTAMALVGDPPIVMLDEPTSGVDPIARRQFWKIIGTIRASGQAVILTSHSMEECEALCGRLGIMVNGQMQCVGGVEHLKHKYAQGFSVMIKLTSFADVESEAAQHLQQLVLQKFNNISLKDKHQNVLLFQISDSSIPWHVLFQVMEEIKHIHGSIMEDYCINATTLEEVFLSFARKSYNERVTDQPWYRRMLCMS